MYVRQTIEIRPNNKQKTYFRQCFGAHRLAYNYGLAEWIRRRDRGEKTNVRDIRAQFNREKAAWRWPFLGNVSSSATNNAFEDLKRAFDNFFNDSKKIGSGNNTELTGYPTPKDKSYNSGSYTEYFSTDNSHGGGPVITDHRITAKDIVQRNGHHNTRYTDVLKADNANTAKPYLRLPRLDTVRMTRPLRYEGRPVSVTIRQHNERFYACFMVEVTMQEFLRHHPRYAQQPTAAVGIDLGIKELAVTSDGISIQNPRPWERQLQRENRLQERMNHCQGIKQKKSLRPSMRLGKNFLKRKYRLWRLRTHVANRRADLRNKLCAAILANYQHIAIETLSVRSMPATVRKAKNKRKLRLHLADVSLYEIRHRLQTLGELLGRNIVLAPNNFPSTRRCCHCGHTAHSTLDTRIRTFRCPECGNTIDRDLNAAINLINLTGIGNTGSMPDADSPMRSDLIRSNIPHELIGHGKEVGTRS